MSLCVCESVHACVRACVRERVYVCLRACRRRNGIPGAQQLRPGGSGPDDDLKAGALMRKHGGRVGEGPMGSGVPGAHEMELGVRV